MPAWKTRVRHGDLTPFWPLTNANSIVVMVGEQGNKHSTIPFNYKKSDFNVLQFDTGSEVSKQEKKRTAWGDANNPEATSEPSLFEVFMPAMLKGQKGYIYLNGLSRYGCIISH